VGKEGKSLSRGTVFDTTLGGISGKKYYSRRLRKQLYLVVDEWIVFYVEGSFEDNQYWIHAYDTITSSFTFVKEASCSGREQVMEGAVDEEEVIE
jgi:hypothetical protein